VNPGSKWRDPSIAAAIATVPIDLLGKRVAHVTTTQAALHVRYRHALEKTASWYGGSRAALSVSPFTSLFNMMLIMR
jgi:hypothetical protein